MKNAIGDRSQGRPNRTIVANAPAKADARRNKCTASVPSSVRSAADKDAHFDMLRSRDKKRSILLNKQKIQAQHRRVCGLYTNKSQKPTDVVEMSVFA